MAEILKHIKSVQVGNKLNITFHNDSYRKYLCSEKFLINDVVALRFQLVRYNCKYCNGNEQDMLLVGFYKLHPETDKRIYTIKYSCAEFAISETCFTSDDGTWHVICQPGKSLPSTFNIMTVVTTQEEEQVPRCERVHVDDVVKVERVHVEDYVNSFASLHEDEDFTDFELRGEGGAVHFHKAVLAAASPVFRRMLCGTWKETTEGHVDVPGTSKDVLQSFKDYVYLLTLPSTGLEQLLLLACCYMMPDLEHECVVKLAQSLTAQNTCDLLEFAVKNKVNKLMIAILETVENSKKVTVKDIKQHLKQGEIVDEDDDDEDVNDEDVNDEDDEGSSTETKD